MENALKRANFVVVDVHFLNFSHDLALGRNVANYTPPPNVQQMERDLAPLAELLPQTDLSYGEYAPVWGWNVSFVNRLRAAGYSHLPTDAQLAEIRRLSSRLTAVEMLPAIRRCLPQGLTVGRSCFVSENLASACQGWMPGVKRSILKAPYSGSGRGLRLVESSMLAAPDTMSPNLKAWISRCLREQGGVVVEPYYNKVADFALEFVVTPSGVEYLGLSVFVTNGNNVYSFNYIAPQPYLWQKIEKLVPALDRRQLITAVGDELQARLAGHYLGPVGVDMMVVDDCHTLAVHPCVEVNVRRTMGELSLHLLPLMADGAEGRFRLLFNKSNAALRREISAMSQPRYDERGGLVGGTRLLTPVADDTSYVAMLEA